MLIKLAWRNIWRSKTRSMVVITAVAIGLLAGVFASGFVQGIMNQKVESVIEQEMSHFQFHHTKYRDEFATKYVINDATTIENVLKDDEAVKAVSSRVISMVMMASANYTNGVKAMGVDPETEPLLTPTKTNIIEGKYFEGTNRNPVLISKRVAEKYKLKLKSKIVLTFQDINNEMVVSKFKVAGIFDSHNGLYDEMNIFVRKADLSNLLGMQSTDAHEIAVLLKNNDDAEVMAGMYQSKFTNLEVLSWLDLATGMRYMVEMMGMYTYILVGIIMLALIFSIINTMLMAVLDRTHEIGMLMAVGMGRLKIFSMIMYESIMLSFVGGPLGLLLSWIFISYFGSVGIDLGSGGEMYEDLGYASKIYPTLTIQTYFGIGFMVFCMGVLSAIYPSVKALRLNPVEAIRKL